MAPRTKLRQRREEMKMSRPELGRRLGVTDKTIERWEGGTSLPREKMWPKLEEVTEKPIAELLGIVPAPHESEHA